MSSYAKHCLNKEQFSLVNSTLKIIDSRIQIKSLLSAIGRLLNVVEASSKDIIQSHAGFDDYKTDVRHPHHRINIKLVYIQVHTSTGYCVL